MMTDNGESWGRTGGLSISLSSPDGRVIGGGVAGVLKAATPVQVFTQVLKLYFMKIGSVSTSRDHFVSISCSLTWLNLLVYQEIKLHRKISKHLD